MLNFKNISAAWLSLHAFFSVETSFTSSPVVTRQSMKASVIILVGAVLSKYVSVHVSAIFCLKDSKDFVCSGPNSNGVSFSVSLRSGSDNAAKWDMNLLL